MKTNQKHNNKNNNKINIINNNIDNNYDQNSINSKNISNKIHDINKKKKGLKIKIVAGKQLKQNQSKKYETKKQL